MADETYMSAYTLFREALEQMDKPRCVQLALYQLETKTMGIVELYTQVLAPALNSMTQDETASPVAVWREHIRSAIIRTIIECCYPYLLEEMTTNNLKLDRGTVVIVSPTDEYHELGARMGSDFFNLCSYRTLFVGANTPKSDMIHGLEIEHPDYVVINAVNYYNVFKVKAIVAEIRSVLPEQRILVSGYAFRQDKDLYKTVGAVGVISTIDDIRALEQAGGKS